MSESLATPSPRSRVPWWRRRRVLLMGLLVIVLVVVILIAIAIPNHLHPATRARVSTVQAEQRNLAVAVEAFRVAHGRLPTVREFYIGTLKPNGIPPGDPPIQWTLTSPVPFIAGMSGDPFRMREYHYYYFTDVDNCWIIASAGPDHKPDFFLGPEGEFRNEAAFVYGTRGVRRACESKFFLPRSQGGAPGGADSIYDPTNGIDSEGDIIKTGP